jgi:pantothenate kinase type III
MLVVDIGNYLIKLGVFKEDKLSVFNIKHRDVIKKNLPELVKEEKVCLLSSVVPHLQNKIQYLLEKENIKVFVVGELMKKIKLFEKKPRGVGTDRLMAVFATTNLYQLPAVVVSCGTAITLELVKAKDEKIDYEGGFILPGINLQSQILNKSTALLGKVKFSSRFFSNHLNFKPAEHTSAAIRYGIFWATLAAISDIVKKMGEYLENKYEEKLKFVIITGGDAALFFPYLKRNISYEVRLHPHLVLEGLNILGSLYFSGNYA